jgi:hypothetical protein
VGNDGRRRCQYALRRFCRSSCRTLHFGCSFFCLLACGKRKAR